MNLRYLDTAQPGLRWMRSYYKQNPQLNLRKAQRALKVAEQMLQEFPEIGEVFEERENVREKLIQGTAFSMLYTVARECIWVIDIRDTRGLRSERSLRLFVQELRKKELLDLLDSIEPQAGVTDKGSVESIQDSRDARAQTIIGD